LKNIYKLVFILFLTPVIVWADTSDIKVFEPESYADILNENDGKEFTLVFWSITCPSCIRELRLISRKKLYLNEKFVFVSTDGDDFTNEIQQLLNKLKLQQLEHWVFNSLKTEQIVNMVDETWYGEVPRNYFFDDEHNRVRVRNFE